ATALLRALAGEARKADITATFEATHHGPQMAIPSLFVEVGSGPRDWENDTYAAAVARAVVVGYLERPFDRPGPCAVGLGGGHYHPKHADRARSDGTAFGHLIPAYALPDLHDETLRAASRLSAASSVVVDRRVEPGLVDKA